MTKIAINGFGRIGRLFFRSAFASADAKALADKKASADKTGLEIVAINDLGDLENLAYLLQYDTVYHNYERKVAVNQEQHKLIIDGKEILVIQEKEPAKLPWKDLNIDIVVEATGIFESFEKAKAHLDAGAKRVVITAPAKDEENEIGRTVLLGVNEEDFKKYKIFSAGSCTTNAAAPVMAIMAENLGIQKAILNTTHAYTNTQTIVDSPVRGNDFRRGRAGAQNIVPSTTGAAISVTRALKDLQDKFDGVSLRVPIITGSIADITFLSARKTSVEEINDIFKKAAVSDRWQGIIKVTEDQIVSSDIIGQPYGAIIDLKFTKVIDGDLVKILSWYDNEWGYCAILLKYLEKIIKTL